MAILEIRLHLDEEEPSLSIRAMNMEGIRVTGQKSEIRGFTHYTPQKPQDLYLQGGFGSFEPTAFFGECTFFGCNKALEITCHVDITSRNASFEFILIHGKGTLKLKDGMITFLERELLPSKKFQKIELFARPEKQSSQESPTPV